MQTIHSSALLTASIVVLVLGLAIWAATMAASWLVRKRDVLLYLSDLSESTALADGLINGVPLLEAATKINGSVIEALGKLKIRSTDTATIMAHFRADHDALLNHGFVDHLKGYVAEVIGKNHFEALGHHVQMAETTNNRAWDFLVDGHPYQVKSGATAAQHAIAHLQKHPDIPVVTDIHAAYVVNAAFPHHAVGLHEFAATKLEATTSGALHGMDTIAHAGSAHLPVVTVAVSSYQEIVRLSRGHTTFDTALAHVVTDAIGVGAGMAVGAKAGAALGTPWGWHAAAVTGFAGGVVGGIGGKLAATFAKEAALTRLAKQYRRTVARVSADYSLHEHRSRVEFTSYAKRLDKERKKALAVYSKAFARDQCQRTAALRTSESLMLRAARRDGISTAHVAAAMAEVRIGDNKAFLAVVETLEPQRHGRVLEAVRTYVALNYRFRAAYAEHVAAYETVHRSFDVAAKEKGSAILQALAEKAKSLFAECETLREQIKRELRKLGKPIPVSGSK